MSKTIMLMADYMCWPVWDDDGSDFDPDQLPISSELKSRLLKWAEAYNSTLNQAYPPDGVFASKEEERTFLERFSNDGEQIWRELQWQLGPEYRVLYRDRRSDAIRAPESDNPSRLGVEIE